MANRKHVRSFSSIHGMSARAYHAKWAFPPDAKCTNCERKPIVRAITMAPADECEKRGIIPMGSGKHPQLFPTVAPLAIKLQNGSSEEWFVRISMAYSCETCKQDLKRAAAKGPSWCVVEFNEGPNPTQRVVTGAR